MKSANATHFTNAEAEVTHSHITQMSHTDIRILELQHKEISLECDISKEKKLSRKCCLLVSGLISAKLWT